MLSAQAVIAALAILGAGGETVLLDFYSDSCPPCRQMAPSVDRLAAMGYPVEKVNVTRRPDLASRFGVTNIPCFVMLVDGRTVAREVGLTSFERLEQMCKMAAPRPSAPPSAPVARSAPPNPSPPLVSLPPTPSREAFSADAGPADSRTRRADPPPWPHEMPEPRGLDTEAAPSVDDLIAASVRLRIEDPNGRSCGSGTIIDARGGEALILTCGHVFRDSQGRGRIEVDLFGLTPKEGIPGTLLRYDLDRDVALVTVRVPGPVAVARVAPPDHRVARGDRVINVGCNNGDLPTARLSRIAAVDKYGGPPNLTVAGMPVQGRSGGGLFSEDGLVIGVCNAADPSDNEGLYAALASIHAHLDEAELSYVYRSSPDDASRDATLVAAAPPSMPRAMPRPSDVLPSPGPSIDDEGRAPETTAADRSAALSREEQAALEEIRRRKLEGAEVICVIRSRSDPRAQSEILVLNDASAGFLHELAAEARRDARQLTSYEVPHPTERASRAPVQESDRQAAPTAARRPGYGSAQRTADARTDWEPRWREPSDR